MTKKMNRSYIRKEKKTQNVMGRKNKRKQRRKSIDDNDWKNKKSRQLNCGKRPSQQNPSVYLKVFYEDFSITKQNLYVDCKILECPHTST